MALPNVPQIASFWLFLISAEIGVLFFVREVLRPVLLEEPPVRQLRQAEVQQQTEEELRQEDEGHPDEPALSKRKTEELRYHRDGE